MKGLDKRSLLSMLSRDSNVEEHGEHCRTSAVDPICEDMRFISLSVDPI
jgi:hypothetical protein